MFNFSKTNKKLVNIYNMLQPLFLKNITAYPGDQTQSINAAAHSSASRKSSSLAGSNLENEDVSSGSETKGKTNCLVVILLSVYLGHLK